ncbi:translocation/assembly module TamB domain-containing protein [Herbaspirillum sp. YR522]|uniref:translocation/assembly module TamB domain-containing protein n=1 Tax=Herbaspirillum sp. YR522 TaxID=1144342 RepID=UPI00026F4AEF|nr:translocation/assembly module TamB domain-containing protein [Herbaspirillum sp. YR522]EJN02056.1 hypothetical protein PMI40_03179 [Herbaspirillum sp. YR522]
MNDQHPSPSEQPPATRRRRAGRIACWSVGALALAVLAAGGAGLYVVKTESGTRLAWNSAVRLLDGKLSGQLLDGTIADGLRLRDLHYRDQRRILSIDRVDASWHLALAPRKLTVRYLRVGSVALNQQPAPAEPTTTPESLELPLALDLREIALDRLSFTEGTSSTELSKLRLHGQSDGRAHRLVLDSLVTPLGDATARLDLDGKTPFAVGGALELSGQYQAAGLQEKYRLAAQLSGSLHDLGVALTATGDRLDGSAKLQATPFAPVPLKSAKVDLQHLNPQAFNAAAPQADLRITADLAPVAGSPTLRVAGTVGIDNARPGSLDRQLLPLLSAHANVELDLQDQKLSRLELRLPGNGRLDGSGQFSTSGEGKFDFRIAALDLNQVHRQLKPTQLAGPLQVTIAPAAQQVKLALDDRQIRLRLDSTIRAEQVELHQASLAAGRSRLEASGKLDTTGAMGYAIKGRLVDFDPTAWLQAFTPSPAAKDKGRAGAGKPLPAATAKPVQARINMDFDASGAISPELQLKLAFAIGDSSYGALPMRGQGQVSLAGKRLLPSRANLLVAGNTLVVDGSFGSARDRLDLKLDAPHLERLGYGLSGLLRLQGQLSGSQQRPALHATYQAENLVLAQHRLARLAGGADLQANLAAAIDSPENKLSLRVQGQGYQGPQARLDKLDVDLDGTWSRHTLALRSNGRVMDQPLDLDLAAHGRLTQPTRGAYGWDGVIDRLRNDGLPRLAMSSPLPLKASAEGIEAGATRLEIDRMALDLKHLSYRQGRIASAGQAHAIDVGRLLQIAQNLTGTPPPVKTDLVLDGDWDFSLAERASGFMQLVRKSGDARVATTNGEVALGLSELRLRADLQGQQMRVDGRIDAARVGTVDIGGAIGLQRIDQLLTLADASPLALKARLAVPELKRVGDLIGPQLSLKGRLAAELSASGTLGQPRLSGAINGDELAVTEFDQGIQLKDGIVRIVMDDNVIDLRQIEFHGGAGTLRANGKVQLGASNPDLNATITAERLELFASPDRRLMISGQGRIANVNEQLRVDGKFTVDRALFDLPKSSAPKLGDDVVIVRRGERAKSGANATSQQKLQAATEKPAGRFAPVINLAIDLGNDFRFRGTGADLLLRGDMNVHSEPLSPMRATGTINVAEGTYEAFGTKLNIERGIINFQGPIGNPNINILAMRRNQDVEAGVSVTGNVNQPRVQLVSEPNVPDDEKLSWMMFGHGTDSSSIGQRSASSQALALVGNLGGKRIAKDIGLDQFSIGASESGLSDDQVVNLGKAITEKITLGYEQSLSGAASVAKATWQFSQRWSAVARAGTINGLNVVFNRRFD